jgi:hypothetical protein
MASYKKARRGWFLCWRREDPGSDPVADSDGWALVRSAGSHRQFKHLTKAGRVTVSGSLGDDMPKGTL